MIYNSGHFIMCSGEILPVLQWKAGGQSKPKRLKFLEDFLAKQGTSIFQRSRNAVPFENIEVLIKKKKIKNFVLK